MRIKKSQFFLGLSSCLFVFLTGCVSTPFKGETSGYGTVIDYTSPTLPMAFLPEKTSTSSGNLWAAMATTNNMAVLNDPEVAYLLGIGIVENYATAKEAEQAAMGICESDGIPGCQTKAVFQAQCLALAYDYKNLFYTWSLNDTKEEAEKNAMQICDDQVPDNSCHIFGTICPDLAGTQREAPFAETNPEDAALLAHNLALFARNAALLRDQGISADEVSKNLNTIEGDDSGEAILKNLYLQQVQMVYGPFKNISPEEIHKMLMFSHLHDMM